MNWFPNWLVKKNIKGGHTAALAAVAIMDNEDRADSNDDDLPTQPVSKQDNKKRRKECAAVVAKAVMDNEDNEDNEDIDTEEEDDD